MLELINVSYLVEDGKEKKEILKNKFNIWKQSKCCTCAEKHSLYTKKHHFSLSSKNIFHNNIIPSTDLNAVGVPKHHTKNTELCMKVSCHHKKYTSKECDDVYQSYNTNTNSTNITCLTDSFMQNTPYIKSKVINFSKK